MVAPRHSDRASVHVVHREWRLGRPSFWGIVGLTLGALAAGFLLAIGIGVILGVALGVAVALLVFRALLKVTARLRG